MAADDDAALVAEARAGSVVALSRLIDRHQQAVRAFLARVTGNRDEAEDLAQETFLTACSQLASYRGDASVRTWLCAIARNTAIDWRRANGATAYLPESAAAAIADDTLYVRTAEHLYAFAEKK